MGTESVATDLVILAIAGLMAWRPERVLATLLIACLPLVVIGEGLFRAAGKLTNHE